MYLVFTRMPGESFCSSGLCCCVHVSSVKRKLTPFICGFCIPGLLYIYIFYAYFRFVQVLGWGWGWGVCVCVCVDYFPM